LRLIVVLRGLRDAEGAHSQHRRTAKRIAVRVKSCHCRQRCEQGVDVWRALGQRHAHGGVTQQLRHAQQQLDA
jgi:hypothetical protein